MKADKIIIGILGGVAVGALLGILYAPDKGKKTRKKISKKRDAVTDGLKEKLDSITHSFSKKYDSLIKKSEEMMEKEMEKGKGNIKA